MAWLQKRGTESDAHNHLQIHSLSTTSALAQFDPFLTPTLSSPYPSHLSCWLTCSGRYSKVLYFLLLTQQQATWRAAGKCLMAL